MPISDAVGEEVLTRVLGYKLGKGNFGTQSGNLPMRIAVFAEANHSNQSGQDWDLPKTVTGGQQAGALYGYGSPIERIISSMIDTGLIGAIPIDVFPQQEAAGAAAKIYEIDVTGTATANVTHYVVLGGRKQIKGTAYAVNILKGDTDDVIAAKIEDAINNALYAPATASAPDASEPNSNVCTVTSKWKGATAEGMTLSMYTGANDAGITYAISSTSTGTGVPSIGTALGNIGNTWYTLAVNSYGTDSTTMDAFENFNGIADDETPTKRYAGTVMKPMIALTGSVAADPSTVTDARKDQMTIAICPAPLSPGFQFEAAAQYCALFARKMQDNPHLDIAGASLPDMPIPADGNIGAMADWINRDAILKKGCSTADLVANRYMVQDFVTTYHKDGETPWSYAYCRNIIGVDMNVYFRYHILEQLYVIDHVLVNDDVVIRVPKVIKPKQWKQVLTGMFKELEGLALIADADFSATSVQTGINSSNPKRLDTVYDYKRTSTVAVASTTARAGFNTPTA